jgi:acyl-CoA thioester hydrolase
MYLEIEIRPRFAETDANGHINNTVPAVWFEDGRVSMLQGLPPGVAEGLVAHVAIDYIAELHFGAPVAIRTGIQRVGEKSYEHYQEAWQGGQLKARAWSVIVCWDPSTKATRRVPDEDRQVLEQYLYDDALRGKTARDKPRPPF